MYGTGVDLVAASKVIPGGTIKPGSMLKLTALAGKYTPVSTDGYFKVRLRQGANLKEIAYSNAATTAYTQSYDFEWFVSMDLKWLFPKGSSSINFYNTTVASLATNYSISTHLANPNGSRNPRSRSNIALATYTAPPTNESLTIDLTQDFTVEILLRAGTADQIELQGCTLMMYAPQTSATFDANPKLTLCFGDSLTEGAGSTPTGTIPNDWVSQLARSRLGTPFKQLGLGGQKITQIVDRIVADKVYGKNARLILWAGVNDIPDDADAVATIESQINRLIDFRGGTQNLIICNYTPNTTWTTGGTYYTRMQAANDMLALNWSSIVCDLFTATTTGSTNPGYPDPTYMTDVIHHNNAGYAVDAAAIGSKMTALGWAA
jgi:lysophospholipase L1-like esterase